MSKTSKPRFRVGDVHVRAIRVGTERGTFYWRAERYQDGGSKTVWTGWGTRDDVFQKIVEIVAAGTVDTPQAERPAIAGSLRELLGYFRADLDGRTDIGPARKKGLRTIVRRVSHDFGDIRVAAITSATLVTMRDRLSKDLASGTVKLTLDGFNAIWRWAVMMGHAPDTRLVLPKVKVTPTISRATPDEDEVWQVLDKLEGWQRRTLILLNGTGGRLGEVASLAWDRVDLEARRATLVGKTGTRTVPLPDTVIEELGRTPESERTGKVIPRSTRRIMLIGKLVLKDVCEELGIEYFTARGVRRKACDQLYRSGTDVATAAKYLGHSPQVALAHYRAANELDLRNALNKSGLGVRPKRAKVTKIENTKMEKRA